jgi:predicted nucleotidyltransferase
MNEGVTPTPYPELNKVLATFVPAIRETLGADVVGAYLQGSFAVGDFDEHSDVDFVVVLKDELRSTQIDGLQRVHNHMYDLGPEWTRHLEGSYFPLDTLHSHTRRGSDL